MTSNQFGRIFLFLYEMYYENMVKIENRHTFEQKRTYFPVVKVAANRNPGDEFTKVYNQARERVIVKE